MLPQIGQYRDALNEKLATGDAGEASHYTALENLFRGIDPHVVPLGQPTGQMYGVPRLRSA